MMTDFLADTDCWMVIALPEPAELIEVKTGNHFTTSQALVEKFLSRELAVERILAISPNWKDQMLVEVAQSTTYIPLYLGIPLGPEFQTPIGVGVL